MKGKAKKVDATWMAMVDFLDEENEVKGTPDTFQLKDFDLDESNSSSASDEDNGYATDSSHTSVEGNDSDSDTMPDLQLVTDDSNSDDDESIADLDERSEFGDKEDTNDKGGGMAISAEEWNAYFGIEIERNEGETNTEEPMEPFKILNPCDEAYTLFTSAMLSRDENQLINVDLYDSSASRHMSSHRHCFSNFVEIKPKPIMAADKHDMSEMMM